MSSGWPVLYGDTRAFAESPCILTLARGKGDWPLRRRKIREAAAVALLSAQAARHSDDSACPYCGEPFPRGKVGPSHPRRRTRDHILPQAWGGGSRLHATLGDEGVSNVRIVCAQCNERRGQVGHCLAALRCVLDVARATGRPYAEVARQWRIQAVASRIARPPRKS